MKARLCLVLISLLGLGALESPTALAGSEDELLLSLEYDAADLRLEQGPAGWRVRLPGTDLSGRPDAPALPVRSLHLALPPDADLQSVRLAADGTGAVARLPLKGRALQRAPKPYLLCAPADTCPAVETSTRTAPEDEALFQLDTVGRIGPQIMARVLFRPVRLDAAKDELLLQIRSRLRLRFQRGALKTPPTPPSPFQSRLARRLASNADDLLRFYPPRKAPFEGALAVLCSDEVAAGSLALEDFIAAHEERGMTVHLITESDIDAVTGQAPDERPQRIRAWLQQNAENLELEAVLIIGNPDPRHPGLPMLAAKIFRDGENDYVSETPTDAYYADLTGNWDVDGDGRFGEWGDDGGPGGVDFYPELLCGRIPYYGDLQSLDKILRRTTAYLRARRDTTWRRRILFPAAVLFFPDRFLSPRMEGGDVSEKMIPEFDAAGFAHTTLYEKAGLNGTLYEPDLPLTEDEMIKEWNEGYGLVYWFGHGSEDAAWRTIWVRDANHNLRADNNEMGGAAFAQSIHHERLPADRPAIVFHGSCSNGTPENAANIGYTQLKSGAIASYSSTRVAYGATGLSWEPSLNHCDIFMLGYWVMSALRDGSPCGEALATSRAALGDGSWGSISWHSKMATSLYGDPSLSLASCDADSDCDDGLACNGVETCADRICAAGQPVDCSGLDQTCSRGACRDEDGSCQLVLLDGQDCDDGLFCTVFDACADGLCAGRARECLPQAACHTGRCDEETRACAAEPVADGEACQTAANEPGRCRQGLCIAPGDGCSCAQAEAGFPGLALGLLILGYLSRPRRRGGRA